MPGDPQQEGFKAAAVSRMSMTGGGFVGIPQCHVELCVLERVQAVPGRDALDLREVIAYHDFMPGSPPTLHVGATCTAPTNGYHFWLVRQDPQGIDPKDLPPTRRRRIPDLQPRPHHVRDPLPGGHRHALRHRVDRAERPFGIEVRIVQ